MKKRLPLLLALLAWLLPWEAAAQEPQPHEKGAYVDSLNRYYQQADLPLYLYVSHKPDGKPTQLSDQDHADKPNAVEPIYLDGHGKHYFRHVDAIHKKEQNFVVYADGVAPESSIQFSGAPHYAKNGQHFYGKGLKVALSTRDEMSGIAGLYHSLNGEAYNAYAVADFAKEGDFKYRYYAVDHVGNAESAKTSIFTVDLTAPKTYYNVVGINQEGVISTSTKIYLTAEDAVAGVAKTFYRLDDGEFRPYTDGNIPFAILPDGNHSITFYSVDHVDNKEQEQTFQFYLDKTAPIMSADVLGDKFVVGDKVYFSGRTKLKLTAVDNKAGIKEVFYAIDGTDFQQYQEPFYLPGVAGEHVIRYYALDNMQNQGAGNSSYRYDEYRHNVSKVYVDLTGPVLGFKYVGEQFQKGDTIYLSARTKIQLNATDPESGLQYIAYNLDGQGGEQTYSAPFSIEASGTHVVEFFGYDNVNNRNAERFTLVVDNTPPDIASQFSVSPAAQEGEVPVYPSYATIFLSATDTQTGYERITYSLNGAPEVVYAKPIQGLKKGEAYTLTIKAVDKLGNERVVEVRFRTTPY
jgi:hypothetical protein